MPQGATQAVSSQGTLFQIQISPTYQDIIEVYGIDPSGGESEELDVTTMGSPGSAREKLLTFRDSGQYDFEINHLTDDVVHQALETHYKNRTSANFKITGSDGEVITFAGRVKKYLRSWRTGEAKKASCSVLLTGDYSVTP